jgi:hypothetical protein
MSSRIAAQRCTTGSSPSESVRLDFTGFCRDKSQREAARVRRPIAFLLSRGSGTRLPARVNGAICASNTPIHFAVTVSKSRAASKGR